MTIKQDRKYICIDYTLIHSEKKNSFANILKDELRHQVHSFCQLTNNLIIPLSSIMGLVS